VKPGSPGRLLRLVLVSLCLCLAGCLQHASNVRPDGRTEVVYWEKWTSFEGETIRELVNRYNDGPGKTDRIFVKLETISQLDRKTLVAIAGGNPPDVAGTYDQVLSGYAAAGALLPLDNLISESKIDTNDFVSVHWRQGMAYGQTWGVPSAAAAVALHYNKKLFRRAGLDPDKPPRTIAEFDVMAEKLTQRDPETGMYTVMGFLHSEPGWFHRFWPYYFGGRLWDGKRHMELDSEPALAAWTWIQGYSTRYGAKELLRFGGGRQNRLFNSPQNLFLAGRVAMELQGTWMHNFIEKYAPGMEWGVAPFPTVDGTMKANPGFTTDLLVIPKGSRHPRQAWRFIAWMLQPEQCEAMAMGHRKYPIRKRASDVFWQKHPNPHIREFFSYANQTNAVAAMHNLPIGNLLIREIDAGVDELIGQKNSPAKVASGLQTRLQEELEIRLAHVQRRALAEK
jgi:multiple sugar transport system substrate-binding protein